MAFKKRTFLGGLAGALMLAAVGWNAPGYGEEPVREYFPNGKREGLFKTYYENGRVAVEESYKHGKQEGPLRTYYENGQLRSETFYKGGERKGKPKLYRKDEAS